MGAKYDPLLGKLRAADFTEEEQNEILTAIAGVKDDLFGGDITATLSSLKTAIADLVSPITSAASDSAAAKISAQSAESDASAINQKLGTSSDEPSDNTIFGKLAGIDELNESIAGIISGFTIRRMENPPDQQHNYYEVVIDDTVKIEDGTLIVN